MPQQAPVSWSSVLAQAWEEYADSVVEEKWTRLENQNNLNPYGFDPFGFDPAFTKRVLPLVALLYRKYFRVETQGLENIPSGRVLLIANHSGQLPFDGMMIGAAVALEADPPRIIRAMIEKWIPSLPFVSTFLARVGQITGLPDNCRKLLNADEAILVFPEGSRGISKTFRHRYQLQRFGQGFLRLALETRTPIVPVAVVGAEEQAPSLYNAKSLAKLLGMPAFPITPTFPLLSPLGLLPYPTKYRISFGEPLRFEDDPSSDDELVYQRVDVVKGAIERLLAEALERRENIFW